jgi:hypothetical protein
LGGDGRRCQILVWEDRNLNQTENPVAVKCEVLRAHLWPVVMNWSQWAYEWGAWGAVLQPYQAWHVLTGTSRKDTGVAFQPGWVWEAPRVQWHISKLHQEEKRCPQLVTEKETGQRTGTWSARLKGGFPSHRGPQQAHHSDSGGTAEPECTPRS